jgi:hypothetical protein
MQRPGGETEVNLCRVGKFRAHMGREVDEGGRRRAGEGWRGVKARGAWSVHVRGIWVGRSRWGSRWPLSSGGGCGERPQLPPLSRWAQPGLNPQFYSGIGTRKVLWVSPLPLALQVTKAAPCPSHLWT